MRTIADLITDRIPRTLPPTATALDAARRMQAEHIGAILIVDDADGLVGCFTERDLTNRVVAAGRRPEEVALHEVMTRDLFTATPDARIHATACEMQERHIRHLPVVVDGKLIAVLGLRDMQRELLEATRGQVTELTRYICGA